MGVRWQPIAWPITGGIDTRKAPVAVAPGSFIKLQNVRQERDGEWRTRAGTTHNALDDVGAGLTREVGLPGGARVGMTRESGFSPAVRAYSSGSTVARWATPIAGDCSQSSPSLWARRTIVATDSVAASDYCEGSVYSLTAWAGVTGSSVGLFFRITNKTTGADITINRPGVTAAGFEVASGVRPRCISAAGKLWLFYIDTATNSLVYDTWSDSTGLFLASNTVSVADVNAIHFMDALYYASPGTTITVVHRTAAGNTRFLEINTGTLAVTTNVLLGYDTDVALSLLPDPDSSGIRFVAMSNVLPQTSIFRYNSAGVLQTGDLLVAAMSDQVTGVAYQAGAGFMAVYHPITGGIVAVKKRGGVVSAPVVLVPAVATGYTLNTVAWRAIGTDLTRYILGLHSPSSDAQDSYFEMAVPFDTGATVLNSFPEPQARLLPLQSGPSANAVWPGALSHVQDLGNQTFCAGLVRLGRIGRASGTAVNQYAIDAWRVEYPSETTAQSKNWGAGTTTDSAGFIPAGSLLQSVHGEVMSHGVAAIPLKPAFVSQAGGGALTALATYGWFVTVEVPNANGDVWRSPPSTPLVVTLTGANNLVNFGVQISATELANRVITVKIWQTLANGSLYRLMSSRTGLASTLQSFATFGSSLDSTTAGGEPFSGEVPATITPAFTHTVLFGGRMWGITRDFPELWMSKPLQKGLQPEFPGVSPFAISLSDEAGEPTGLAQLDDKLVVFKRNSIYFVQGDGPDNAGGGVAPTVTRIDSDLGSVVGGSTVSTGSEVFFVADRGIHRVKISGEVDYVGSPLDKYFNQVELGSPSVVCGAVFSTTRNEIRFSCSSGSAGITAFVYDRARNIWYYDIWGLGVPSLTRYSSSGEIRYTSTGLMYFEGNLTVSDDAGTPFVSVIGSAWIQGAGQQGRFRVRRARVLGQQPLISGTPTTPVMKIFYNFDESGLLFPTAETASPTAAIVPTLPTVRAEMAPRVQKCTAFRTDLTIPVGSSGLRLEQWAAVIGIKKGPQKLNTAERWT